MFINTKYLANFHFFLKGNESREFYISHYVDQKKVYTVDS